MQNNCSVAFCWSWDRVRWSSQEDTFDAYAEARDPTGPCAMCIVKKRFRCPCATLCIVQLGAVQWWSQSYTYRMVFFYWSRPKSSQCWRLQRQTLRTFWPGTVKKNNLYVALREYMYIVFSKQHKSHGVHTLVLRFETGCCPDLDLSQLSPTLDWSERSLKDSDCWPSAECWA